MNDKDAIAILPPREPLPHLGDDGITVVSFNVLLPNGKDGWWIYKVSQQIGSTGSAKWSCTCLCAIVCSVRGVIQNAVRT